jgi:hypothetical protein
MQRGFLTKKQPMLGRDDWIDSPWKGIDKPLDQRVYDQGFRLVSIMEISNKLVDPQVDEETLVRTLNLLRLCNDSSKQMDHLFKESFKPFLQQKSVHLTRTYFQFTPDVTATTPDDINRLTLVINLWACMLVAGWIARVLRSRLEAAVLDRHLCGEIALRARKACNACIPYTEEETFFGTALSMLQYMPICIGPGANDFAVNRMLSPMTTVAWQFRHSRPLLQKVQALMGQIAGTRHVQFAAPGYDVVALIPRIVHDDFGLLPRPALK